MTAVAPTRDALSIGNPTDTQWATPTISQSPPANYLRGEDYPKQLPATKIITKKRTVTQLPVEQRGRGVTQSTSRDAEENEVEDERTSHQGQRSPREHGNVIVDPLARQADIIGKIWPVTTLQAEQLAPGFCKIYSAIKQQQKPNHLGARIMVQSGLNCEAWEAALVDYHDKQICQYFRYGWPLGYHKNQPPVTIEKNHPSAEYHMQHVMNFVKKELLFGTLLGPFSNPPFTPWTRCSPIMTRPKKDTEERRVIVDLSFPEGQGVNSGIDTHDYFGADITYTLPTISDLVTILQREGRGALVWKADLARAYRQLRVDPIDCPLLGMKLNGQYYLDLCPPFGCKTSSAACQRMSNALVHLMAKRGHTILAYLDDYAAAEASESKAKASFQSFMDLTQHLGLNLAKKKCLPPATKVEWLGYVVDTQRMTVAVPAAKLAEVLIECEKWTGRRKANTKMIQSLVGRLIFLANAITPARKFVTRILGTLRAMPERGWVTLSEGFKLDLRWFLHYSKQANGVFYYTPERKQAEIQCDSSLTGGGGCTETHCYTWKYTDRHRTKYHQIHHLEAINLLVAYRTLGRFVEQPGITILMVTDNISSSFALTTGRTKDVVFANCARELWLAALVNNHVIEICHRPGHSIPLADALSRSHNEPDKKEYVKRSMERRRLTRVEPQLWEYNFFTKNL